MAAGDRVQKGDIIDVVAGAAYSAGDVVPILDGADGLVGIAVDDIANGATGAVEIANAVYEITKATGTAWVVGDRIYWDVSATEATKTATANPSIGRCVEAAASGATTGKVRLDAGG